MAFVGCVFGVYNTWEEACGVQVHQFSGADHKAFKNKRDAEVAFMNFGQIDGGNVQEGSSSSTYPSHSCSSSSTPSTEEIPYCQEDVKYELLKYQLDIEIEQWMQ